MAKKSSVPEQIDVDLLKVQRGFARIGVIGTSPLLCNTLSQKVLQGMVTGTVAKTKVEKQTTIRHNPIEEYRASVRASRDPKSPTYILSPRGAFKSAAREATLSLPGVEKKAVGKHLTEIGDSTPIFGIPQLSMMPVKLAGPGGAPDMRTRAIIPEWAALVPLQWIEPNLNAQAVINLLGSAGVFIGIGDGRPEKGRLSYGLFEVVNEDDARLKRIIKSGGRKAQEAALAKPVAYDDETEELLEWHRVESKRRGIKIAS